MRCKHESCHRCPGTIGHRHRRCSRRRRPPPRPTTEGVGRYRERADSLVPGPASAIDALFGTHSNAPTLGRFGWRHDPIDYRTREGAVLHVRLLSDWQKPQVPDVVRVEATVDAKPCIDAALLQHALAQRSDMTWTSDGSYLGWTAEGHGRVVGLGQKRARCLAIITIDNRRQPRPAPPLGPFHFDPSRRVAPVPAPGH
jgi:hypothetical protein